MMTAVMFPSDMSAFAAVVADLIVAAEVSKHYHVSALFHSRPEMCAEIETEGPSVGEWMFLRVTICCVQADWYWSFAVSVDGRLDVILIVQFSGHLFYIHRLGSL